MTRRREGETCDCVLSKQLDLQRGYAVTCPLHASAPALLAALRYVDQIMDYDGYEDMRDKVQAAIRAAEGGRA